MRRLVALDLPGGATFVDEMRKAHDSGDAVFPVDQRLPDAAKARLFATVQPSTVITGDGNQQQFDGSPETEVGDAFVIATSGTTGDARGVVLTHEAVRASAIATNTRLEVDPEGDRWVCCLPLAHVGGLSVITRSLQMGTQCEVHDSFDPLRVLDAARSPAGATLVSLVPTALARIGDDAGAFRKILLGGSAIPKERPNNTIATYGMTETGSGVVYDGRPLDGVELRIGADAEIEVRAPMLLRAYRGLGDPKDRDGWFRTGDAGTLQSDGTLIVFGRIAEVIRTGGESVYPAPVEQVLRTHPAVHEVVVTGIPDEEWGARVVAFVEPTPGHVPTLVSLRELVSSELGSIFAPRDLIVVDELPRTSIGKVRRDALVMTAVSERGTQ